MSLTKRVRNGEILYRVKKERNVIHALKRWKANWIGFIFRRKCLLNQIIEGKVDGGIEGMERRGRILRQLLGNLQEKR